MKKSPKTVVCGVCYRPFILGVEGVFCDRHQMYECDQHGDVLRGADRMVLVSHDRRLEIVREVWNGSGSD